ncbi:ATPase AAA [Candidatus Uabimicrobium amorphum]|uniref:ATPase AAA n=1 Tax=Uabimicrobium amorphum TaxID=2596890 RepID=A0A5S9IK44_UABAM|nr:ATPase AAA [Candidatus Uabimicrobium amorphum]
MLLLPTKVEYRSGDNLNSALKPQGDFQLNTVLIHYWQESLQISLDADELINSYTDSNGLLSIDEVFNEVASLESKIKGLKINRNQKYLANFSFQKMAMVNDLTENIDKFVNHKIIAAVCGDRSCRDLLAKRSSECSYSELDKKSPDKDFLILDADSSQQAVIENVLKGQNGLIQGPPGTGKSQTIANMIASLIANKKKVLFVAEKRAALDAVKKRLSDVNLGKILFDVHGADVSRKEVIKKIRNTLEQIAEAPPVDYQKIHRRYTEKRNSLNTHVESLHKKRDLCSMSIFELRSVITGMSKNFKAIKTKWRHRTLERISDKIEQVYKDIEVLKTYSSITLRTNTSPWIGSKIRDSSTIAKVNDLVALTLQDWAKFSSGVEKLKSRYKIKTESLSELKEVWKTFGVTALMIKKYHGEIFKYNHLRLARSLAPAKGNVFSRSLHWIFDEEYREAYSQVRSSLRQETIKTDTFRDVLKKKFGPPSKKVFQDILLLLKLKKSWISFGVEEWPLEVKYFRDFNEKIESIYNLVENISSLLQRDDLLSVPVSQLSTMLEQLEEDQATPYQLIDWLKSKENLQFLGVDNVLSELDKLEFSIDTWEEGFRYAWLKSCHDHFATSEPYLQSFVGKKHSEDVVKFQTSDQQRLQIAPYRIQKIHAHWAVEMMDLYPEQTDIIRKETKKKTRHMPLRKLISKTSSVLTVVCPCWMASPLSISQLLEAEKYFDVVIFDEASQILPQDAVSSIVRGKQLVVAGDSKQLPPTTFFAAGMSDVEDEDSNVQGFESLLDILSTFLNRWDLRWHYRSQDERLIAFSNHYVYNDRLVTFPGTGGVAPLSHELVDHKENVDRQEQSSATEVNRVVELIIQHSENYSNQSLGVVALSIKHAERIQSALDTYIRNNPVNNAFFAEEGSEHFFIKNLERVQGDERDHIMISVGYGKNRAGVLRHNFGPINKQGGERRLNVLVTRARQRITVVSSFTHQDIDLQKTKAEGAKLLKYYLEYAINGGHILGDDYQHREDTMNAFELDVHEALTDRGMKLLPQFGVGNYKLDFAVQHPKKPGLKVLAIECDGVTYHSAYTARERDRLRQQQLEAIGWNFCRIWSTDWFLRKEEEINRVVKAYENALTISDKKQVKKKVVSATVAPIVPTKRPTRSASKPRFEKGTKIGSHSRLTLQKLLKWIESDGKNRTKDELFSEMMKELGYKKRGSNIVKILNEVIEKRKRR